ncbi:MAG: DUF502 domain-containing protein [Candidatus Eremiobacteraeota bacterium]|nr:DUF502 domain-containing protein [Candidatus Eremiobacteraeota bacterium]MBV8365307.1 DUF502 domain-containing protein [Candidatus Eremiobacteraeota bacterium]
MIICIPIYLAALLLLKASQSLVALIKPLTKFTPDWLPAETVLSLLAALFVCFLVGVATQTRWGQSLWERIEAGIFARVPGYELFRGLMQRLSGAARDQTWKPALAEIEDALVPAFIIEELADGRLTVFVPSIPTPLAGAVYILDRARVHPVDVPFTKMLSTVSRWGSGSKDLIAALEKQKAAASIDALVGGPASLETSDSSEG